MRIGDLWLLALFGVLIIQSVYGLFCPLPADNQVETIDIVFRTSEAAIFGYIISSNFGRRRTKSKTVTQAEQVPSIGFDTQSNQAPTMTAATGKRTVAPEVPPVSTSKKTVSLKSNTTQLTLVGVIGLVSLLVLIGWRNFYGHSGGVTTNMTAVITQYRDMVSGCVGFLIGQPQASSEGDG